MGNFPNIFAMPHFRAVAWNPIPLDAATAATVTTALANGYNGFLTQMAANGLITEAEKTARTLTYAAGSNPILISDETLTDLSPYMARAGRCAPTLRKSETNKKHRYHSSQHGNSVGYAVGGDPTKINGVTVPLGDQYALIPTEIIAIETARASFNATVKSIADGNPTRLALADVDKAFTDFITAKDFW